MENFEISEISLMNSKQRSRDKQESCDTPADILLVVDKWLLILIWKTRSSRNSWVILTKGAGVLDSVLRLCSSPSCYTLSNAFFISRKMDGVCSRLFECMTRLSIILTNYKVIECPFQKVFYFIFGFMYFLRLPSNMHSNIFEIVESRDIRQQFSGLL